MDSGGRAANCACFAAGLEDDKIVVSPEWLNRSAYGVNDPAIQGSARGLVIIQRRGSSDLFITQPDHAALAADIMREWRGDDFSAHPRRDAILYAVREHDNGWIEEDLHTHVDASGRPLDFVTVAHEVKHRIWPRAVERIGRERPYEAALIAQHALTVHAEQRANPAWRTFFETMEGSRATLLRRTVIDASFEADYRFVRIGDLLSLILCNGWTEPHTLPAGGQAVLNGSTLVISPDPFDGRPIRLAVRARRLDARTYGSAEELRHALDRAAVETLEGTASGGA